MPGRTSRWARPIIVVTCLVTGGLLVLHFAMTFLLVAPRNAISASADEAISSYMLPYFEQDWSLFAPDPVRADPHVLVRAKIVDAQGQQQVTSWLDVTNPELARVQGHPFPDQVSRLSAKVAASLFDNAEQQERAPADEQRPPMTGAPPPAAAPPGTSVTDSAPPPDAVASRDQLPVDGQQLAMNDEPPPGASSSEAPVSRDQLSVDGQRPGMDAEPPPGASSSDAAAPRDQVPAAGQETAAAAQPPPDDADEAFARTLATLAARAQWGEQVREVQLRLVGQLPPPPALAESEGDGDTGVREHELPWWPAAAVTPAALATWKEIHR